MADKPVEIYQFGDFQLNVGERTLERRQGCARIVIPEKAFQALVLLVRSSGALVRKDSILATVWPGVVVEEGNIGKVVHTIRRALGDGTGEGAHIETVPKHGYRFIAEVTSTAASTAGSSSAVPVPLSGRSPGYDAYMRGKVKAGGENLADTTEAIALLEAAVALDPASAVAYAQLARAYTTRSFKFASQDDGRRFRENADVALAKALDLAPNLAEAHFARGLILWTKAKGFPHEQAIKSFQRALELDPAADETHHQLSMVYAHVGLLDEAHRHVARAIELNPNNSMARFRVGVYTAWQCRFEEALAVLKTVPADLSPLLVERTRAEVYIQLGRPDKARQIIDHYLDAHPHDEGGSLTGVNALLLAKTGQAQDARRMIARAVELGTGFGHFHHTAYNIAATYAVIGEPDEAVDWVEAAADDGFPCYPCFARDPSLAVLRGFPRFDDVMAQLRKRRGRFRRLSAS